MPCARHRAICATTHSQTVIRPPRRYHHLPMLTCIQPPRALGLTDHSSSGDQVRQIEDSCQAGVDGVLSCQNNPSPALQSLLTNVSLSDLTIANRVESPHPTPCISATSFQGHSGSLLAYDNQFHTPSPMRVFSTSGHEYFDYQGPCDTYSRIYSERFPENHYLDPAFTELYLLGDELGSGGYGFVMTALHRELGLEVAVKFIVKNKVPEKAWVEDNIFGKIPAEIMILRMIDHENIVKCLDVFEDELYFYAVQELHGFPWQRAEGPPRGYSSSPESSSIPCYPLPSLLSPTASDCSNTDSEPETPPQPYNLISAVHPSSTESVPCYPLHYNRLFSHKEDNASVFLPCSTRRPSHDLFEYIEQTKHKRLSEAQARYIMAQVVEAVYYLDSHGIAHRDIKDENLLIDRELKIKLIDFGSATMVDPRTPRPFYKLFFGTTAYAAPEVLLRRPYQAAPAEVWTLGVLMSYLLTGMSPFPTETDAISGHVVLAEAPGKLLSSACLHLMSRCLEPEPLHRANIEEVRNHTWFKDALHIG